MAVKAVACRKSLFDTFDENLRIFIEQEENCGNLKKSHDFPGDFPTEGIIFFKAVLRKVF